MKFKRRQILFGGMGLGIAVTAGADYQARQAELKRDRTLEILFGEPTQQDTSSLVQAAFEADTNNISQGRQIQQSLELTPPAIPYNRDISKLLIQCNKIATQQYLQGKTNPNYSGSIKSLPAYSSQLNSYTQIASFTGEDVVEEETVEVDVPTTAQRNAPDFIERNLDRAESTVISTAREIVRIKKHFPVYLGFVLTSKTHNIIVFRGSQTNIEWIKNLTTTQEDYIDFFRDESQFFGKVHEGFLAHYGRILSPRPREIAVNLDPSLPCYITGHSLGAALATLAAMDIGLHFSRLRQQMQLYTYGSPRIGNPVFAKFHNQLIPNTYRVVNLADSITLIPPTQSAGAFGVYSHVGQEWSFLTQNGDFLPNHVVDTYYAAVEKEVETNQNRTYPVSG